jgi:oxygen tolerance protein BatD
MIRLSALFFFLVSALRMSAQSVHWEPATGSLGFNQTSELQLVFDNCEPKDDPAVPAVAGLELQSFGQASNMSITNGRISQSVVVTFHARASQHGTLTIPPFMVNTNKGRLPVPAAVYEVGAATVGQGRVSLDDVANSSFQLPSEVWAGEVFKVEYTLDVARRYFHSLGSNQPEWNPAPLSVEEWGKPVVEETLSGGERRIGIHYRARGSIKSPGQVTLNPATQLVNLTTGAPSFGFFSQPTLAQYTITSDRPSLQVKPLPRPAPTDFNGAVGQFTLQSKVVPIAAAVGEPITWTLTLAGTGNWPEVTGLPSRDVSRDFRVVQPQARRVIKEGLLYEGTLTEDVVLIPTQPGSYTLGPVSWSYFDPAKGAYQTVTTEKVVINVSAAPLPAPHPSAASPAEAAAELAKEGPAHPAARPALPSPIPRDLLNGEDYAATPWAGKKLAWIMASPLSLFLLCWIGLAARRARQTDPLKAQREARLRLRETLRQLRESRDRKKTEELLQSWQHDAAILWELQVAAPSAETFLRAGPDEAAWSSLWHDLEQALYRAEGKLPSDWVDRAEIALVAKTLPAFSFFQLFRSKNLLPFAALLVCAFVSAAHLQGDVPAADAYQRGDFPAAEAAWRQEVASHPTDWIAQHNLSVALAQQNRWGESAGHAAAAFVQHPRNDSVKWELALASERAGFAPGPLGDFDRGSPLHSLAALLSPSEWQHELVAAIFVLALAGIFLLLKAYRLTGRWAGAAAITLFAVAIVATAAGAIGLSLYQEAGDARAALVWKTSVLRSIPTEADTTQKTTPLAAGTVAIVNKTFLNWSRLEFPNGQTGWVRQDDLVSLWH